MKEFVRGLRKGLPIAVGYLSVSFTFGGKATNGGIPAWIAVLMSFTNLTSAGQFAGATLMIAQAGYLELAVATFVINIRYLLMSLALSQKLKKETKLLQRMAVGFGITDEIFAVASTEPAEISARYMYGLISLPVAGWTMGTLLGALASHMPAALSSAMELGLYAMFIAIIVPPARKNRAIALVILLAVAAVCVMRATPVLNQISTGFQVILAAVLAAAIGAVVKPVEE